MPSSTQSFIPHICGETILKPVSSFTSRITASVNDSPASTWPSYVKKLTQILFIFQLDYITFYKCMKVTWISSPFLSYLKITSKKPRKSTMTFSTWVSNTSLEKVWPLNLSADLVVCKLSSKCRILLSNSCFLAI